MTTTIKSISASDFADFALAIMGMDFDATTRNAVDRLVTPMQAKAEKATMPNATSGSKGSYTRSLPGFGRDLSCYVDPSDIQEAVEMALDADVTLMEENDEDVENALDDERTDPEKYEDSVEFKKVGLGGKGDQSRGTWRRAEDADHSEYEAPELQRDSKRRARPEPTNPCLCGCGTLVHNTFRQGHDQRVKGYILKAAKAAGTEENPADTAAITAQLHTTHPEATTVLTQDVVKSLIFKWDLQF